MFDAFAAGMESKRHYGEKIESRAWEWLKTGVPARTLLARNFSWRGGELDLVFQEGRELVFVEVRARVGGWVSGLESIDARKRLRLIRTIRCFLARYHGPAESARFDVVDWDGIRFRHYRDIRLHETIGA